MGEACPARPVCAVARGRSPWPGARAGRPSGPGDSWRTRSSAAPCRCAGRGSAGTRCDPWGRSTPPAHGSSRHCGGFWLNRVRHAGVALHALAVTCRRRLLATSPWQRAQPACSRPRRRAACGRWYTGSRPCGRRYRPWPLRRGTPCRPATLPLTSALAATPACLDGWDGSQALAPRSRRSARDARRRGTSRTPARSWPFTSWLLWQLRQAAACYRSGRARSGWRGTRLHTRTVLRENSCGSWS